MFIDEETQLFLFKDNFNKIYISFKCKVSPISKFKNFGQRHDIDF